MADDLWATKKPTRDYQSYSRNPWTLWDVMYQRRSCRKYLPLEPSEELVVQIDEMVSLGLAARGAEPGSVIPVTDPHKVDLIRRRSHKGFQNKINLWLSRTPLSGFFVIALPKSDVKSDRPRMLPASVMAVEDCVLWLTENGLGSCWLAGVNESEIKRVLGLEKDISIPSVVCFGKPKSAHGVLGYDNLTSRTLSRRRKPLEKISSKETMEWSYRLADLEGVQFRASPVQNVKDLLRRMTEGEAAGEAPLPLVLEACLEAARIAPNGGNFQKWRFVTVEKKENLSELRRACCAVIEWRAAVLGAGYGGGLEVGLFDKPFWMIDLPIALSHISLMALSAGMGAETLSSSIEEEVANAVVGLTRNLRTVGVVGIF